MMHDSCKVNVIGQLAFSLIQLTFFFISCAEAKPCVHSLFFQEMTTQKHTLFVLSLFNLFAGPVRLQGTIDFLLYEDVKLWEDRAVLAKFVHGIQPFLNKNLLCLRFMPLIKEFLSRASGGADFQSCDTSFLEVFDSKFTRLFIFRTFFAL